MAQQVEDLIRPLFSEMSEEEQLEFIRKVRQSRSTPKVNAKKRRNLVKKFKNLIAGLSDEEKRQLIAEWNIEGRQFSK
jgi:hypothetical protein